MNDWIFNCNYCFLLFFGISKLMSERKYDGVVYRESMYTTPAPHAIHIKQHYNTPSFVYNTPEEDKLKELRNTWENTIKTGNISVECLNEITTRMEDSFHLIIDAVLNKLKDNKPKIDKLNKDLDKLDKAIEKQENDYSNILYTFSDISGNNTSSNMIKSIDRKAEARKQLGENISELKRIRGDISTQIQNLEYYGIEKYISEKIFNCSVRGNRVIDIDATKLPDKSWYNTGYMYVWINSDVEEYINLYKEIIEYNINKSMEKCDV